MATGTFILRPVGTISCEHTCVPEYSLDQSYLCVNEAVADDDATHLYTRGDISNAKDVTHTSVFVLGGDLPNNLFLIKDIKIHSRHKIHNEDINTNGSVNISVELGDVSVAQTDTWTPDSYDSYYSYESNNFDKSGELKNAVNIFIGNNRKFPTLNLRVKSSAYAKSGKSQSYAGSVYITQVYIEVTYETINPVVNFKKNGTWMLPIKTFKKSGGYWSEISMDDCKSLLVSRFVMDKCAHRGHGIEVPIKDIDATCTETGMTGGCTCQFCGRVLKEHDTVIPALGHNEVATKTTATCTAEGMTGGIECSRCGVIIKEHDTVQPALGHNEVAAAGTATCTEAGMIGGTKCSRCGTTIKEHDTTQPALGHNYNSITGDCDNNGCSVYHPDSFTFTVQINTSTAASTYNSMPNITWRQWVEVKTGVGTEYEHLYGPGWYIEADGSVRYTLDFFGYMDFRVDGVKADDLIIAGHAYTATDLT